MKKQFNFRAPSAHPKPRPHGQPFTIALALLMRCVAAIPGDGWLPFCVCGLADWTLMCTSSPLPPISFTLVPHFCSCCDMFYSHPFTLLHTILGHGYTRFCLPSHRLGTILAAVISWLFRITLLEAWVSMWIRGFVSPLWICSSGVGRCPSQFSVTLTKYPR